MHWLKSPFQQRRASTGAAWLRLVTALLVVYWLSQTLSQPALVSRLMAQEERNPVVGPDATSLEPLSAESGGAAHSGRPALKQRTIIDSMKAGGVIGLIIVLMSIVAVAFVIEHSLSIRKQRLMPDQVMDQLEEMIARGDIQGATQFCQDPHNYSLATDVVLAGLERFQSSEFGFADYKSAVEEAGEDHTARLYRKTDGLNLIGVIAPMLGLFGTVQGMITAFNVIASSAGRAETYQLADGISQALITTWLGLVVAIPSMVAFSFFRNKIDSLVSECGKRVERVLTPLSRRR
jgi:biopolymer transport protein ExbB